MDRAQKVELVSTLNQVFSTSNVVVVTHYSGLSVKEITDLRNQMREAGASFRVTKNRLTKLAPTSRIWLRRSMGPGFKIEDSGLGR